MYIEIIHEYNRYVLIHSLVIYCTRRIANTIRCIFFTFLHPRPNAVFLLKFFLRNTIFVIDIHFFPSILRLCRLYGPAAKPVIPELHGGVVVITVLYRFTLDPGIEQYYENVGTALVITILRFNLDLFVCFCEFE